MTEPAATVVNDSEKLLHIPGHIPVLCDAVVAAFSSSCETSPVNLVDATLGAGGHTRALLQAYPQLSVIGCDQDPDTYAATVPEVAADFPGRFSAHAINFSQLPEVIHTPITGGILVDLGVSSMQLDRGERGFSFQQDAPLDMRMDTENNPVTAATLLAKCTETQLADWLYQFGEERLSRPIARAICRTRDECGPLTHTKALADIAYGVYLRMNGKRVYSMPIHPATRTFQALRIVVNDELGHLERLLASLPPLLAPGAVVAIISFHSLEDRLIKQTFKAWAQQGANGRTFVLQTKKPIVATEEEIQANPRSRSAKLRVIQVLSHEC